MEDSKKTKVVVIGAGAVGSTVAYTLIAKNLASSVFLIDVNEEKLEGEVMDMEDSLSFSKAEEIKKGDYKDASDADLIILTAGMAQRPGQNRLDLVKENKEIIESIFKKIGTIKSSAVIIVVSNPVDVLTYKVQEVSGLSKTRVFGTGTSLDTARLRRSIAERFGVESNQVEGFVLGEHGDSEFVAWSTVSIGGKMVKDMLSSEEMNTIERSIKEKAYEIINKKGATYYGIAMVVADITEAIFFNQNKILPVSFRLSEWNGVSDVCIGAVAVIGERGVTKPWQIYLSPDEKEKLKKSAGVIKKYL